MNYQPMLASIGSQDILKSKDYQFEPKFDGTRAIATVTPDGIRFVNRNGNILNGRYPELEDIRKHIRAKRCVLDGEIVIYNHEGLPDFQLFQQRDRSLKPAVVEELAKRHPATYVVFDVLEDEGESLFDQPIEERQALLGKLIRPGRRIEQMLVTDDGKKLWREITKRSLEGVMAKRVGSSYAPGVRSKEWLKIKNLQRLDGIIVGYLSGKRAISSLAIAAYKADELIYLGNVGTGFTEEFLGDLKPKLDRLARKTAPVVYTGTEQIHWLKPQLVAEIQYLEFTPDGSMRVPSFIRLRDDKKPEECVL